MPFADACIPRAARSSNRGFLSFMRGSVTARDGITANWVCGGSSLTLGRFSEENFCFRPLLNCGGGEGEGYVSSELSTNFIFGAFGSLKFLAGLFKSRLPRFLIERFSRYIRYIEVSRLGCNVCNACNGISGGGRQISIPCVLKI
jgi:hypothetical protein